MGRVVQLEHTKAPVLFLEKKNRQETGFFVVSLKKATWVPNRSSAKHDMFGVFVDTPSHFSFPLSKFNMDD